MDNYKVIALWREDDFQKMFFEIRKAISEVHKQHLSEDGIRINMPVYVIDLMQRALFMRMSLPLEYEEGKTKMFGYPVYPSFENLIVVFHIDMPIYGNTSYQVIDLKKIQ